MILLRREFLDGPECPELVLLHYSARAAGSADAGSRATLVMPAAQGDGRREVVLMLPDPPGGEPLRVRYSYSTVAGGVEWNSPPFEIALDPSDLSGGAMRVDETPPGNLRPAAGLGMFRLLLPLRAAAPGQEVRYGFGAMRKKPSAELCRAGLPAGEGGDVLVEAPEALSVLKERPMPYFLYHVDPSDGQLRQDKIAPARITYADEEGQVVAARLLWGDSAWKAPNLTVMELKGFREEQGRVGEQYFAEDPAAFAAVRQAAMAGRPLPRVFEAFLYGPSGSDVEYCFQLLVRRPDGALRAEWRNREGGGNWRITL